MCEIHIAWPTDRIVLYVEDGEKPLVVKVPGHNVDSIEAGVVEGGNLYYNDNANVSEIDEVYVDCEEDKVLVAKQNENVEFNWLGEGFEGPNFDDDVFGNQDVRPYTQNRVGGNGARDTTAPQRSNVAAIDS